MGLFGSKAPVTCAVCGKETGTADNKKHKAKDGVVCQDCFLASGLPPNGWAGGITVAEFKEQLRSADGLTIIDRQKQRLRTRIHKRLSKVWKCEILTTASAEATVIS